MANGKVDLGVWLSEAWALYRANFGLLFAATLVAGLLGVFTCGLLAGPLGAGLTLIILRLLRNESPAPQVGDVFKGFDFFLQALLLTIVIGVAFAIAGWLPLVGIVAPTLLWPLVMFSMCLLADRKMEFWPAIQASYEKAKGEYVSLLVLCLVAGLISAAGAILCGIGVFLTAPFGAITTVVAYRHMFGEASAVPEAPAAPQA